MKFNVRQYVLSYGLHSNGMNHDVHISAVLTCALQLLTSIQPFQMHFIWNDVISIIFPFFETNWKLCWFNSLRFINELFISLCIAFDLLCFACIIQYSWFRHTEWRTNHFFVCCPLRKISNKRLTNDWINVEWPVFSSHLKFEWHMPKKTTWSLSCEKQLFIRNSFSSQYNG